MDKPESEEDEDHWKDASPLTPICSPAKHALRPAQEDRSKRMEADVQDFYPASSESLDKDVIIIDSSIALDIKVAARYSQDTSTGIEKVAPKVKLKRERVVESEESVEQVPEAQSAASKRADLEKKTLRRLSSVDRISLSESSSKDLERGAKKKVLKKRDSEEGGKKVEGEEIMVDVSRRGLKSESEEPKRKKDGCMSREHRKSLKEQECIERVTEFLTKHSALNYLPPVEPPMDQAVPVFREPEPPVTRPSSLNELELARPGEKSVEAEVKGEKKIEEMKLEEKKIEEKKIEEKDTQRSEATSTPGESTKTLSTVESEKLALDRPAGSTEETKATAAPETEAVPKRRSSLRKKTFSRESSRESLLDEAKKEVRIQENVEEIFFEDASEQISGLLPEVQLVTARIITAEEAAANRIEEPPARVEVHSPPEVIVVSDTIRVRSCRVPSPETVDTSHLQSISLAKSTSENTLVETTAEEENKVSQRNLKAEILLDLSKVSDVGEEVKTVEAQRKKREKILTRTGSEGSKRGGLRGQSRVKGREGLRFGSLAVPDEPELTILLENVASERRRSLGEDREATFLEDSRAIVAKR